MSMIEDDLELLEVEGRQRAAIAGLVAATAILRMRQVCGRMCMYGCINTSRAGIAAGLRAALFRMIVLKFCMPAYFLAAATKLPSNADAQRCCAGSNCNLQLPDCWVLLQMDLQADSSGMMAHSNRNQSPGIQSRDLAFGMRGRQHAAWKHPCIMLPLTEPLLIPPVRAPAPTSCSRYCMPIYQERNLDASA